MKKNYTQILLCFFTLSLGLVGNVKAQLMALPPHSVIYTGSVRGYWFTAPISFTITGLKVCPEAGTGLQYIHVFKINDAVPVVYAVSSTNFTTLAYIQGAPNNVVQTVNIAVNAGDKIGILGQAGNNNSYSAATASLSTTIAGNPVTLARLLYQGYIVSGPAPNYSTEPASNSISRVEMWYSTGPLCPVPTGLSATAITQTSANLSWNAVTGSIGYEYAVTTSATPPATGTATAGTTYNATGLPVNTLHYLHVRNKCSATNFSQWVTQSFSTLNWPPCPAIGVPVISNNIPGSVDISWTAVAGSFGYQYAVTQSISPPASGTATTNTNGSVSGLTPGATYYAHVRNNCSVNFSPWATLSFVNPFPPCYAPAAITVANINVNAAEISWNSSATVLPAAGYQYAITTNATPPVSGATTVDTFYTAINLLASTTYFVHVRTHCGTTNYSPWATTSFITPAYCVAPVTINISNVTASSAIIDWNSLPGTTGYEYFLTPNSSPPVSGVQVFYNNIAPINLFDTTTYYIHVRRNCGSPGMSQWYTASFTTLLGCDAPLQPLAVNVTNTTAVLKWAKIFNASDYEYVLNTTFASPSSGISIPDTFYNAGSLAANTVYYFHVRTNCTNHLTSPWKTMNFKTLIEAPASVAQTGGMDISMDVYPNPVTDVLNVRINGLSVVDGQMELLDMSGKIVRQIRMDRDEATIDMSDLSSGLYLLRYLDTDHRYIMRIQKL